MEHPHGPGRADRELISGWRYWQLGPDGRLRSVAHRRVEWAPGRPLRAFCLSRDHLSPGEGCNCGIYAASDLPSLRRHRLCLAPEGLVVGRVSLSGRVTSGEDGYRGEYAYPAELFLVPETVMACSVDEALTSLRAYGVPVSTMPLTEAVGDVSLAVLEHQLMSARLNAGP